MQTFYGYPLPLSNSVTANKRLPWSSALQHLPTDQKQMDLSVKCALAEIPPGELPEQTGQERGAEESEEHL